MNYYKFNSQIVAQKEQEKLKEILNSNDFTNSPLYLGQSKGRGITWFLKTSDMIGVDSVLRHYYRGGFFGKFIQDSYWFSSLEKTRAVQEFNLLQQMVEWQLPVPRPIAVKVDKKLFCYRADILLEKINNTQDLSVFLQQNALSDDKYQQIGGIIKQLHRHQVHHSDLNIHNILFDEKKDKFWLIDFDKCQIQSGDNWKKENLDRLLRSFKKEVERLKINFNQKNWESLLKGYNL